LALVPAALNREAGESIEQRIDVAARDSIVREREVDQRM
jgi:hypothetical protein